MSESEHKIIELEKYKVSRKQKSSSKCPHTQLSYDSDAETVYCRACETEISSFRAFLSLVEHYQYVQNSIEKYRAELKELEGKTLHYKIAKDVERCWRRDMAIDCPFCHMGILPEDGFGGSARSREYELQRRQSNLQFKRSEKDGKG